MSLVYVHDQHGNVYATTPMLLQGGTAPSMPAWAWWLIGGGVVAATTIAAVVVAKKSKSRPRAANLAGQRIPPYSPSTPKAHLEYAFHTTTKAALDTIRRDGLQPASHSHLDEDDEAIFVERDEEGADVYADPEGSTVMLRFLVDGFGSTDDGEDVLYDVEVPPDQIEVRTKGGWKPLMQVTGVDNLFGLHGMK